MQSLRYRFYNLLMYLVDAQVAFDCDDTQWLACGYFPVLGVDAGEEGIFLAFEATFVDLCIARVAAAGAGEGSGEIGKQEDGQVWLKIVAEETVQIENDLGAELAAASLVGLGGVGEAVAENEFSCSEGGLDDFLDRLCAVSEHHGELGVR